jgi:hypothetical protein
MPDRTLSCEAARALFARYAAGEPSPALARHLDECDACLEACMEEALRHPPAVPVPADFRERVLAAARREHDAAPLPGDLWVQVTAACLPAILGVALWWVDPNLQLLRQPVVCATALGIETVLAFVWVWRVKNSAA